MKRILSCLFIWFNCFFFVPAQSPADIGIQDDWHFGPMISDKEGLLAPTPLIFSVDGLKRIWIGTDFGVNMIDRKEVKPFPPSEPENGLYGFRFKAMKYHKDEKLLFVGGANGLFWLKEENTDQTFIPIIEPDLVNKEITSIEFYKNIVFVSTKAFLLTLRIKKQKYQKDSIKFVLQKTDTIPNITSMKWIEDRLAITTDSNFYYYDFIHNTGTKPIVAKANTKFKSLIRLGERVFWVQRTSNNEDYIYYKNADDLYKTNIKANFINSPFKFINQLVPKENTQELIVCSEKSGLQIFKTDDQKVPDVPSVTRFEAFSITAAFVDSSGGCLIGIFGKGITFTKSHPYASTLRISEQESYKNITWAFAEFQNKITGDISQYLASDKGIVALDADNGYYRGKKYLEAEKIYALALDTSRSHLYLGTESGYIYRYEIADSGELENPKRKKISTDDLIIRSLGLCKSTNRLYIGLINKDRSKAKKNISYLEFLDLSKNSLSSTPIDIGQYSVYTINILSLNSVKRLLLGTFEGDLIALDIDEHSKETSDLTLKSPILSIEKYSENELLVGTANEGLKKLVLVDNPKVKFDIDFSFNPKIITAYSAIRTQKDGKENIWVATNKGIAVLDGAGSIIKRINSPAIVQSQEFNGGASYYSLLKNQILLGGVNGTNIFSPKKFDIGTNIKKVYIQEVFGDDSARNTYLTKKSYRPNGGRLGFKIVPIADVNPYTIFRGLRASEYLKARLMHVDGNKTDTIDLIEEEGIFYIPKDKNGELSEAEEWQIKVSIYEDENLISDQIELNQSNVIRIDIKLHERKWFLILIALITIGLLGYLVKKLLERTRKAEQETLQAEEEKIIALESGGVARRRSEANQKIARGVISYGPKEKRAEYGHLICRSTGIGNNVFGIAILSNNQLIYSHFFENGKEVSNKRAYDLDSETYTSLCFRQQKQIFVKDAETEWSDYGFTKRPGSDGENLGPNSRSMAFIRLEKDGEPFGVMTVQDTELDKYDKSAKDLLIELAKVFSEVYEYDDQPPQDIFIKKVRNLANEEIKAEKEIFHFEGTNNVPIHYQELFKYWAFPNSDKYSMVFKLLGYKEGQHLDSDLLNIPFKAIFDEKPKFPLLWIIFILVGSLRNVLENSELKRFENSIFEPLRMLIEASLDSKELSFSRNRSLTSASISQKELDKLSKQLHQLFTLIAKDKRNKQHINFARYTIDTSSSPQKICISFIFQDQKDIQNLKNVNDKLKDLNGEGNAHDVSNLIYKITDTLPNFNFIIQYGSDENENELKLIFQTLNRQ